jgi:hypothetical protein
VNKSAKVVLGHGLINERIPGRRCGNWYFVLCGSVRFTRR